MAGVPGKRASADRARLVTGIPTEGDLILALLAEDVAHGAAGDGDAGGNLVTDRTLKLPFHFLCQSVILSIINRSRGRLRNYGTSCRHFINWILNFFLDGFNYYRSFSGYRRFVFYLFYSIV